MDKKTRSGRVNVGLRRHFGNLAIHRPCGWAVIRANGRLDCRTGLAKSVETAKCRGLAECLCREAELT
jgi:hypothetical protein